MATPYLRPLWQSHAHRRLVEPFCGGLAIALGLRPERALLNDANPHLMNFYAWIKKGLVASIAMENDEKLFYRHRDRFNELIRAGKAHSKESAELFYYMNRTAYNGLCRFNSRGEFNTPVREVQDDLVRQELHTLSRGVCRLGICDRGFCGPRAAARRFRLRRSAV